MTAEDYTHKFDEELLMLEDKQEVEVFIKVQDGHFRDTVTLLLDTTMEDVTPYPDLQLIYTRTAMQLLRSLAQEESVLKIYGMGNVQLEKTDSDST